MAVELGGAWREDEELQITPLTGGFELAHELGAAVHLNGPDGEGRALLEGGQEVGGGAGSGYGVDLNHIPARYDVAGGELLEDEARQGSQVQGVQLHQVARGVHRILLGLADGVRALRPAFPGGDGTPGRLTKEAAAFQGTEDAADHGGGDVPTSPAQEDHQLVLPPAVPLT
jgi:hypothetical protein